MVRIRILVVTVVVVSAAMLAGATPVLAGTTWTRLGPFTSSNVYAVHALDENVCVVGGSIAAGTTIGVVYRTANGGTPPWQGTTMPGSFSIADLSFCDGSRGWAIGMTLGGSPLYRTTDGGVTWTSLGGLPAGGSIRAISFVDANNGWGVGQSGRIVRTSNGGTAWTEQVPGSGYGELRDVDFTDTTHGWAVGSAGKIVRTVDGGAHWTSQASGVTTQLNAVAFADSFRGVAVGDEGVVLNTTNGGATWTRHTIQNETMRPLDYPIRIDFSGVSWADGGTVYAVGEVGTVVRSVNGGAAWRHVPAGGVSDNLIGVSFAGPTRGFATAQGGRMYRCDVTPTPDAFTQWTKRTSGTTRPLLAVDFVDDRLGWVVGHGGTILKTTNGGTSWTSQDSGTTAELAGVDFMNASVGWVVGYDRPADKAVILATTDGGATWARQTHPSAATVWPTDVLAVDALTAVGFAGGTSASHAFFRTVNGGASWASVPNTVRANMFGASRLFGSGGSGRAWAVGYPNTVMKTADGGAAWTPVPHGGTGTERLVGAAVIDASRAIVVGDTEPTTTARGIILRTTDFGASWSRPSAPTARQLRGVDACAGHVWIVGEAGAVYHSADAGATWGVQTVPAGTPALWGIECRSPDLVWAVGLNGTILTGRRPAAKLSRPSAPAKVKRNAAFTVKGTLQLRQGGTTPLTFCRKTGTKWVKYRTFKAKNVAAGSTSRYALKVRLPSAGRWYVQAAHSSAAYRPSLSAKRYFTVK